MKRFVGLIFFILPFIGFAEDYYRYEENGKIGIKDDSGGIILSAEFEELGWSDGKFSVVGGLTGYRSSERWGLINLKKEFVTKADFISLLTTDGDQFIAEKALNPAQNRWGCIDSRGRIIIPFEYDGIQIGAMKAIVKKKEGINLNYGLVDTNNRILIPVIYQRIYALGTLRYAVENSDHKLSLFAESGQQITPFHFDSISSFQNDKAILYKDFKLGVLHRDGRIIKEPTYREIALGVRVTARNYDQWQLIDNLNQSIKQFEFDEISGTTNGYLVKSINKSGWMDQHFNLGIPMEYDYLSPPINKLFVARQNGKFGILHSDNSSVLPFEFDSIHHEGNFVIVKQNILGELSWSLYDTSGIRKSQNHYDGFRSFNGKFFLVNQNQFVGAVDRYGKEIVRCVFDSLLAFNYDQLIVKYRGSYGIMDFKENWILPPQHYPVKLINESCYLEVHDSLKFLKNFLGEIIYFTDNELSVEKEFLMETLPDGSKKSISFDGLILDRSSMPTDQVLLERVYEEKEGMRAIRKDGKFGFIDVQGKLRIANRYDSVKSFSEELAPFKIIGRWGFIDKSDNIVINPHYDYVEGFDHGLSLVRKNGKFGLINMKGIQILPPEYDGIKRFTNHKFLLSQNDKKGFADDRGHILVESRFDELQFLGNGYLIVGQNNQFGLISEEGLSVIPILYDEMIYLNNKNLYLTLQKQKWKELEF